MKKRNNSALVVLLFFLNFNPQTRIFAQGKWKTNFAIEAGGGFGGHSL